MSFLKQVATRSNDQTNLIPGAEPSNDAYTKWKAKNYTTELMAQKVETTGYRNVYGDSGMWRFFKILKHAGLLGSSNMAREPGRLEVDGMVVMVDGMEIYVDSEGFEL